MSKLLDTIDSPDDLRKLPITELGVLAGEIRERLIETVSRTGGHLAPSLGVVELTIALHYSYHSPLDKLIWDVGHQAYVHKLLTGRRGRFDTLRQYGGISGFPRTSESVHDAVSGGHASTSISAGLGMAAARDILGEKHSVVAIIGDGSLSGGLAFEGLNNLGIHAGNMTVILNDNAMSISRNVGALSRYLTRVITDRRYNKIKNEVWELLGHMPAVGKRIRSVVSNVDEALKHFVIPGKLFEDMGLRYLGPVDGHNLAEMIEVFRFVRENSTQPVLIHVLTKKGKGYTFAEKDATKFHGVGCFEPDTGAVAAASGGKPTFSQVFGATLVHLAEADKKIVAVTAAMVDGTGLGLFRERFAKRFFDVGIAESHAVTFAAGLAHKGLTPVVALYSTFLQRTYDQILHDVALDNLHVVFCIDRAGLVGDDGPTHHGMFDLSFLRTIPNLTIMAPRNAVELHRMLTHALTVCTGPVCIRYPRGSAPEGDEGTAGTPLVIPAPQEIHRGTKCTIVSVGDFFETSDLVRRGLSAAGIDTGLVDARFVKPLDRTFYRDLFSRCGKIITLEPNSTTGGFGSALMELASQLEMPAPPRFLCLGYPDAFVAHGSRERLYKELGLDVPAIVPKITAFISG